MSCYLVPLQSPSLAHKYSIIFEMTLNYIDPIDPRGCVPAESHKCNSIPATFRGVIEMAELLSNVY